MLEPAEWSDLQVLAMQEDFQDHRVVRAAQEVKEPQEEWEGILGGASWDISVVHVPKHYYWQAPHYFSSSAIEQPQQQQSLKYP